MKNYLIVTLLIVLMSGTMAMAQTKKPTTPTKKPSTTVKSNVPKTTTTKKTTTTTTTTTPVAVPPPVVEEKKTTTTTETPTEKKTTTTPSSTTTTTTTQSSGPSKGKKNAEPRVKEPKPERVREPRPERVREPRPERVREPRVKKERTPRVASSGDGGVRFGIRAEASQLVSFETGGNYDFSPGVNAGLFANIPFSEKISIQPEILYSMAVAKVDPAKGTVNTILAPVTLNVNLGNGPTKFVVSLGGYAQYLLSQSKSTGGGISVETDLTGVDKFGYGAVLGLGVKINSKLLIETRAFYDLKESNNKTVLSTIGIGYMF